MQFTYFSFYFLGSENGGKNNASDLKKMANFKAPLKLHFSGESTPTTNLLVLNEVVIDRGKYFTMSTEFDKNISDFISDCTDYKKGIGFTWYLF